MILSMTGYGEAQHADETGQYALEIRSLNNRYFKTNIKLPEYLQFLETEVEKLLRARLQRGSVTYSLRVRNASGLAAYDINVAALQHYLDSIGQVRAPDGVQPTLEFGSLLGLPGVCQPPELGEELRSRYWAVLEKMTAQALDQLVDMRKREGAALREDLLSQCKQVRELTEEIAGRTGEVVKEYQLRLVDRVNQLLADAKLDVDSDSLLREISIYAERSDVNEEVSRLRSHLQQFADLCDSNEYAGRKLDFYAQEMLREANTIGSKSNDAGIARNVVTIKGCIDRLKEQVQNVE